MLHNTSNFSAERGSASADADRLYEAACFRELRVAFPGIAHDMRGFLNNMALNFELLKGTGAAGAGPAERYRDAGLQQIRNLDKSLRWVIELLDREEVPPQSVDLNAFAVEVHAMVKSYARHSRKNMTWTALDAPVFIQARIPELRRALMHIVLTAIEATATDGKLMVELKCIGDKAILILQGDWMSEQQGALIATFRGRESDAVNLAYGTLAKAGEILRTMGGEVHVTERGEDMMIEISFAPIIAG